MNIKKDLLLRICLKLIPKWKIIKIIRGPCKGFKWIRGSSNNAECIGAYEIKKQLILGFVPNLKIFNLKQP